MPKTHEELHELISKANPEMMKKVDDIFAKHSGKKLHDDEGEEGAEEENEPGEAEKSIEAGELDAGGGEGDHEGVLDDQAKTAVKAIVRILTPFKDKISPAMLHEVLEAADFSMKKEAGADEAGEETGKEETGNDHEHEGEAGAHHVGDGHKEASFMAIPEEIEGVEKEHMKGAKDAAEGAYKTHLEKLGYQKYPAAEMAMKQDGKTVTKAKGEPVSKAAKAPDLSTVDPETRQKLEAVFKSNAELVKKNADLETRIKAGEEKAREKEIVSKAAGFTHVALAQDDIVATLKDADKIGKESYERICKQFETLNEQGKSSKLFGEFGSSLPAGGSSSENSWSKIEKAAEGYVAKSGAKVTTKEEAVDAFLQTAEGQKMYGEHQAGRKDGI